MPIEQFVNDPTQVYGSVASDMGAADATILMNGGTSAPYPQTGSGVYQFRVLIDTEIIVVASGQGTNTWGTLTRGADGTTAAPHTHGATVYPILTKGALANLGNQGFQYISPSGLAPFGAGGRYLGMLPAIGTLPGAGSWQRGDWGLDWSGAMLYFNGSVWRYRSLGPQGSYAEIYIAGSALTANVDISMTAINDPTAAWNSTYWYCARDGAYFVDFNVSSYYITTAAAVEATVMRNGLGTSVGCVENVLAVTFTGLQCSGIVICNANDHLSFRVNHDGPISADSRFAGATICYLGGL